MAPARKLSPAMEDYLEAIYALVQEEGFARVGDIARRLKVRMPSVTGALRALAERDLVRYEPYRYVRLTTPGRRAAARVAKRHEALTRFLTHVLKLDADEARQNACGMEHALSDRALDRMVRFVEFVRRCPRGGEAWIRSFRKFCDRGETDADCRGCIEKCLAALDGGVQEEAR
jgi:DtxR family Mn-dependent transcriptional regulator